MTKQEIATRNAIIESSEDAEPTYNVYELCMGVVEFEEGFDSFDDAITTFCARWDTVATESLNDYGPEEGDGLYLYDTVLGNVISYWDYFNQSFLNCFQVCPSA